jgi:hypothetical protein
VKSSVGNEHYDGPTRQRDTDRLRAVSAGELRAVMVDDVYRRATAQGSLTLMILMSHVSS